MSKRISWLFFLLYLTFLTKIILFKNRIGKIHYFNYRKFRSITVSENFKRANIIPLKTITKLMGEGLTVFVIENIIGNIIVFIPYGILLPILLPSLSSFYKIGMIAIATSLIFELIQLVAVLGIFDVDDIILNTLGAVIGFAIYQPFQSRRSYY